MIIPDACNCCTKPPCDPPTLVGQSWSVSKTKCGYTEWPGYVSTPPKYYLVWTGSRSGGYINNLGSCTITFTRTITELFTYDPSSCSCTGLSTMRNTASGCASLYPDTDTTETNPACGSYYPDICDAGTPTYTSTTGTAAATEGAPNYNYQTDSVILSDEYTTDLLKTTALAALPSTPNGVSYSSYAHLSADETSYAIVQAQTRLKFSPPGTCYLKVWYVDVQKLVNGTDAPVYSYTPVSPYEWDGTPTSGGFCVKDSTKSVLDAGAGTDADHGNQIWTDWLDLAIPSVTAGQEITVTRTLWKYSCLPGYEPADPDFSTTTGEITRPATETATPPTSFAPNEFPAPHSSP